MKVKRFADRVPEVVLKHIEEAGDIEIINLFDTNNRTVVYYAEAKTTAPVKRSQVQKKQPTDKGLKDG